MTHKQTLICTCAKKKENTHKQKKVALWTMQKYSGNEIKLIFVPALKKSAAIVIY